MKINKIISVLKVVALLMLSTNSFATVNLMVNNASVNPDPIEVSTNFEIAIDIVNASNVGMGIAEPSGNIEVIIDILTSGGTKINTQSNLGFFEFDFVPGSEQNGWSCAPDFSPGTTQVVCNKAEILPPDDTTISTLGFSMVAGSFTIPSVDFNINVLDTVLTNDNPSNSSTISTSVINSGMLADLDFDDTVTQPSYDIEEGQLSPAMVPFRILNNGMSDTFGGTSDTTMVIMYDTSFVFNDSASTYPVNWTCDDPNQGQLDCETSAIIVASGQVDFLFAFDVPLSGVGTFPMNASVSTFIDESDLSNNSINTSFNVSAPINDTDLNLLKFAKDAVGGSIISNAIVGESYFYSIQVNNPSPIAADMVEVSDSLPLGVMAINDATPVGMWSCNLGTYIDEFTPQVVNCSHPSIAAGQPMFNETIYIEVQAVTTGVKSNIASVSTITSEVNLMDNDNSGNPNIITIDPEPFVDITITNEITQGTVPDGMGGLEAEVGSDVTFRVLVTNNGVNTLNKRSKNNKFLPPEEGINVTIVNTLPAGLTYVGPSGANLEVGPNFSCSENAGTITCNATSLPLNFGSDDGFEFIANVTGTVNDVVTNSASVTADNIQIDNIADSMPFTIVAAGSPSVDLVMNKESQTLLGVSETVFGVDQSFNYVLTITNSGIDELGENQAIISDVMPPDMDIVGITSATDWNCANSNLPNGIVDCFSTVAIQSSGSSQVVIEVKSQQPGNYDNVASTFLDVSSSAIDTDPSNNDDHAIVDIVVPGGALTFVKDIVGGIDNGGVKEFIVGDSFQYQLTVENISSSANYTDLIITDSIDTGTMSVQAASADFAGIDCNVTGNDVTCSQDGMNPLLPGNIATITIDVFTSNTGNLIGNIGHLSSVISGDDFDSNNVDINILPLLKSQVELTMGMQAQLPGTTTSETNFDVGQIFEYSLVVHNTGPDDVPIGEVELTNLIPSGIDLAATPTSPDWDCSTTVGNTVKCINLSPITAVNGFLRLLIPVSSTMPNDYFNQGQVLLIDGATVTEPNAMNNGDSVTVFINAKSGGLTLSKSVSGGSLKRGLNLNRLNGTNTNFAVGDTVIYTLLATNTSASTSVSDLVVKDTLDTSFLSFDSFNIIQSSTNFTCAYDGTSEVSCTNISGSPMLPGDDFEVEILATAQTSGTGVSNTAQLSSDNTGDNLNSNTVFIDIDGVDQSTTLSITKDALVNGSVVSSVFKGSEFTYRLRITNTGTHDAQNVILSDDMPTGVTVINTVGADWNCKNKGQQYNCNLVTTLLAGASTSLDFNVRDGSLAKNTQLQNNANVVADNAPLQTTSNTITLDSPMVILNVTQNPNPVLENSPFDLIIDVNNTGNGVLQGVQVVNVLPEGFSYNQQTRGNKCNISGLTMTCILANGVASGSTESLVIPVLSIESAVPNTLYNNQISVSGSNFGLTVTDVSQINVSQPTEISTDLSIVKTASVSSALVDSDFSYNLMVTNTGDHTATNVVVTDELPKGMVLNSITAPDWQCTGTTTISCNLTSLLPDASQSIQLLVKAPSVAGLISNTASVFANENDPIPANNLSKADVDITLPDPDPTADISMTKTASTATVASGQEFTWNLEIKNNGPNSATNVTIIDQLPTGFVLNSISGTFSKACTHDSSTVTCNIPLLENSQVAMVSITGTAEIDSGVLDNLATVSTQTNDPNPKDNSDMASVMVELVTVEEADLSISIDGNAKVNPNDMIDFNLNISNKGPNNAATPNLDISLTGQVDTVVVSNNSDWSCKTNNLSINCHYSGKSMPSGHMSTLIVSAQTPEMISGDKGVGITASISSVTQDPIPSNNMASSQVSIAGPPTEIELLDALNSALGSSANLQIRRAIQNVSSYCANRYENALEGLCDTIYHTALEGDGETIQKMMEEITPNEVIGQSSSVSEIATAQFRNVGSRLSQLRAGGGSGFSSAGLNARYGNGSLPLGMLAYLNESKDGKETTVSQAGSDFISPWGFFVNGSISMGERDATGRELGFDFDTFGLTAGIDYRLSSNKVVGVALGYANFDSKIEDSAELKSTGVTLTGYGSFNVNDNFYVDARISFSNPDFDQSRDINFSIDNTVVDRTAVGKTDANQYSVAMSAGYSFYKNAWNITPNASIRYVSTDIDSFTETGAGAFNFFYSKQQYESLVWSTGLRVSKAISLKSGVITPQFDFDYNYESMNDGIDIEARFIMAPDDEIFIIETDSPDRTYGSAGIGLVYITSNGKQAYINYRSILGLEGFNRGTFNLGARFEF